jgi:hypothetical protein
MLKTGRRAGRILLLTLLLALCAAAAAAQDEAQIAIARLAGKVEVLHKQDTAGKWVAASTDDTLGPGWQLRTLAGGKAQLVFPRDNVVILKENSVLYIDKLDLGGGAAVEAEQGSLLVDIKNALAPGSEFELKTPTALAVVRGTKYGAEINNTDGELPPAWDGDGARFFGYEGTVEILNDQGGVYMAADTSVEVGEDGAPGDPTASDSEAEAFLAELEDTGPFDAAEAAAGAFLDQLEKIHTDLLSQSDDLSKIEDEWQREEHSGQDTQLLYLYTQALKLREAVDEDNADYLGVAEDIAAADEAVPGLFGIGGLLEAIQQLLDDLYARLDALARDAGPLVGDAQELLDSMNGLVDQGDPALGLRWRTIDSDNDGISDVDETALGLDPFSSDAGGAIRLLAPDADAFVQYPDQDELTFRFEPLDSELIEQYSLVLEGEGRQWMRQDIDSSEDVDLAELVGDSGAFFDLIGDDGQIELEWSVVAPVPQDELSAELRNQDPGFRSSFGTHLSSEKRKLTLSFPQPEAVVIDLTGVGPTQIRIGEQVIIRARISAVEQLQQWELSIAGDPSVLEFVSGRRLGIFGPATLFFGDDPGGVVSVSGSVPRGSAPLSGEGDIFELTYNAVGEGQCTLEVLDIALANALSQEIPGEAGDSVEVEVLSPNEANVDGQPGGVPGGKPTR